MECYFFLWNKFILKNNIKVLLILLVLLFSISIYSKEGTSEKSIYFELGGSAGFASLNYESVFTNIKNFNLLWRAGLSAFPIDINSGIVFVVPVIFGALYGAGKHKLELGIGQGLSFTITGRFFALMTVLIGYRYQSASSKYFYRATYTPLLSYIFGFQYQHWLGLSMGYRLNFLKQK